MVETETEEEHDNIIEEVLRRIVENGLFVKQEKYVWKVREVGFLGVVIGPNRVKIEKKKVQEVVDWLVLRICRSLWGWQTIINGLSKTL